MTESFLASARRQFAYYRMLGEKSIERIPDDRLFFAVNDDSNSLWVIVKHLSGNMLSRWTDFLTSDGEKAWRNRDGEFVNDPIDRAGLMDAWNRGWSCLFHALDGLKEEDLSKTVFIRGETHSVMEAIHRQLAHYPYHVGQIVFIAKIYSDGNWDSLSIPKGGSDAYNAERFGSPDDQ
jgi:hypothetical protein